MKKFKGTRDIVNVGDITAYYKPYGTTFTQRQMLKKHGYDKEFECFSVGNNKGQVALFPTDDTGKEVAEANAKLFVASKDLLEFAQEMAKRYPNSPWITEQANKAITKALGE